MMRKFAITFIILHISVIFVDSKILNDCVCGAANIMPQRIVNGDETNPHKYPWLAAMHTSSGYQMCGGAIIGDRTIITAGHCISDCPDAINSKWLLGSHNLTHAKIFENDPFFHTIAYEFHPKFLSGKEFDDFDMALVTLHRTIEFNAKIRPICLPAVGGEEAFHDKSVIVAGWGKLSDKPTASNSDVLLETRITLKRPEFCEKEINSRLKVYNHESMICGYRKDHDACQGDSGGPLFVENQPNRYQLIGVVSFGLGCARDLPGIYGKISNAKTLNWIQDFLKATESNVCFDLPRATQRNFYKTRNCI